MPDLPRSRDLSLYFATPYISGRAEARHFKFCTHIEG